MNSPEIKQFIRENSSLFWYIPEKENISSEVLVEFVLNFGDGKSVKKLFDLMGIEKTAEIFLQTKQSPTTKLPQTGKKFLYPLFQTECSIQKSSLKSKSNYFPW